MIFPSSDIFFGILAVFCDSCLRYEEGSALADGGKRVLLAVLHHVERLGSDGNGGGRGVTIFVYFAFALVLPAVITTPALDLLNT